MIAELIQPFLDRPPGPINLGFLACILVAAIVSYREYWLGGTALILNWCGATTATAYENITIMIGSMFVCAIICFAGGKKVLNSVALIYGFRIFIAVLFYTGAYTSLNMWYATEFLLSIQIIILFVAGIGPTITTYSCNLYYRNFSLRGVRHRANYRRDKAGDRYQKTD